MNQQHLSMVFIPGFMLDESLWDELIPELPAVWNIYRTSMQQGQTVDEIAAHTLLQAPSKFILVGFSMGGYIARAIAQKYPDRVQALILVASSIRPDSEKQKQLKIAAIQAASASTFHGLSKTAISKSLHPIHADNRQLIQRIQDMGKNLGFESFKAQSLLDRSHIRSDAIQCPTLIISAAQDRLRSLDEAQELHQSIAHSQLYTIENTGHMIPLEQPEALAASMLKWLNTLPL
ncbi:alpha/beta fold hydrolase [Acinetobacter sp. YH16057]|uniref:alpha/beta fold hydrolase n=1 Tax=Acinetobacter sp. YH16057 TaxID=2601195 RepID=UPI0015D16D8A|nr:alpha/beta hydrolase [Acinetobacter sp. YH16057]